MERNRAINTVCNSEKEDKYKETVLHDAAELLEENVTQAELSLQRIAMVQIVRNFLDTDWMKKTLLKKSNGVYSFQKSGSKWHFIFIDELSNNCRALRYPPPFQNRELPSFILTKLLETVEEMGLQISPFLASFPSTIGEFNERIYHPSVLTAYLTNIQWTDTGRLNYNKTAEIAIDSLKFENSILKFSELCSFCLEDNIEKFYSRWKKVLTKSSLMKYSQSSESKKIKYIRRLDYYLMAYWHFRCENKHLDCDMSVFVSYYKHYYDLEFSIDKKDASIDVNSYLLCLWHDHFPGINYFWSRIDEKSRDEYYTKVLGLVFSSGDNTIDDYGPIMDIRFSLLRKMSLDRWYQLLNLISEGSIKKHAIISLITSSWRDFSFPPLEILIKYISRKRNYKNHYFELIKDLCYTLRNESEVSSRKKKTREVIEEVFRISAETFKICWKTGQHNYHANEGPICQLLRTKDMPLIKMFFNNVALKDIRKEILHFAAGSFSLCRDLSDMNIDEQFQQEILLDEEEREFFYPPDSSLSEMSSDSDI